MRYCIKHGDGSKDVEAFSFSSTEVIIRPDVHRRFGCPWMLDLSGPRPRLYVESIEVANELAKALNYLKARIG